MALGHYKPVLIKTQEAKLAEHCKDFDSRCYGLTPQALRKLGYKSAEANSVKHLFDKSSKMEERIGHIDT